MTNRRSIDDSTISESFITAPVAVAAVRKFGPAGSNEGSLQSSQSNSGTFQAYCSPATGAIPKTRTATINRAHFQKQLSDSMLPDGMQDLSDSIGINEGEATYLPSPPDPKLSPCSWDDVRQSPQQNRRPDASESLNSADMNAIFDSSEQEYSIVLEEHTQQKSPPKPQYGPIDISELQERDEKFWNQRPNNVVSEVIKKPASSSPTKKDAGAIAEPAERYVTDESRKRASIKAVPHINHPPSSITFREKSPCGSIRVMTQNEVQMKAKEEHRKSLELNKPHIIFRERATLMNDSRIPDDVGRNRDDSISDRSQNSKSSTSCHYPVE